MLMMVSGIAGLPNELTARDQWVCWRGEERDGKATKVPVEPLSGGFASTTDPATWTSIASAIESIEDADANGIGFVFTDDDPFIGVDLDNCRDPGSGTIDDWARDVVIRLDSYAEVSPSGTGVHIIAEGELPAGRSRSGDVEMYETSRFFTVTGDHLDQTPTQVRQRVDAIRGVHADYVQDAIVDDADEGEAASMDVADPGIDLDDAELLERARAAENGDRFDALWRGQTSGYDSHSEADMALSLHLAFWTGGDPARMDSLFRQSGLMREKWDEVHYADGATYGERTIERATERVDEVYEPDARTERNRTDEQAAKPSTESATEVDDGSSRPTSDDSIYLEERNRLLRERVRTQQATIERQAARIDQLQSELETVREAVAAREQLDVGGSESSSPWRRLKGWLTNP